MLWKRSRTEIVDDLVRWLDNEIAHPGDFADRGFEVAFGGRWMGENESPYSRDEPLALDVDGQELRLRGRIDRLEWTPNAAFRVIDYKSGSNRQKGVFNGGRSLQLAIYLLAGADIVGIGVEHGRASYSFATRRGGFSEHALTGRELERRARELRRRPRPDRRRRGKRRLPCRAEPERMQVVRLRRRLRHRPPPDRGAEGRGRAPRHLRRDARRRMTFVPVDQAERDRIRDDLDLESLHRGRRRHRQDDGARLARRERAPPRPQRPSTTSRSSRSPRPRPPSWPVVFARSSRTRSRKRPTRSSSKRIHAALTGLYRAQHRDDPRFLREPSARATGRGQARPRVRGRGRARLGPRLRGRLRRMADRAAHRGLTGRRDCDQPRARARRHPCDRPGGRSLPRADSARPADSAGGRR